MKKELVNPKNLILDSVKFIENGLKIKCTIVDDLCISLDTHEDIPIIKEYLKKDKIYAKYKI
jgi:CMP-2-keto-3-deoxyoctulosonic acid synthetase